MKKIAVVLCVSLLLCMLPASVFAGGGEVYINFYYIVSGESADSNVKFLSEGLLPVMELNHDYGIASIYGSYEFTYPDNKHNAAGGVLAGINDDGTFTGVIQGYMFDWEAATYTVSRCVVPKGYELVSGSFTLTESSEQVDCFIEVKKSDKEFDERSHIYLLYWNNTTSETGDSLPNFYTEPMTGEFVLENTETGAEFTINDGEYTPHGKLDDRMSEYYGLYIWNAEYFTADIAPGFYSLKSCPLPKGYSLDPEYYMNGSGIYISGYATTEEENKHWLNIYIIRTSPPETPSDWATGDVTRATELGLLPALLKSNYTQSTTRAEFCALAVNLYEVLKGEHIDEMMYFRDTDDENVQKMGALGVVTGIGDGYFAPDNELTREQAAVMLARLAEAIGKPLPSQQPTFADNSAISSWALNATGQIQAAGIMGGVGSNTFAPAEKYTREQSIITIMRLYDALQ